MSECNKIKCSVLPQKLCCTRFFFRECFIHFNFLASIKYTSTQFICLCLSTYTQHMHVSFLSAAFLLNIFCVVCAGRYSVCVCVCVQYFFYYYSNSFLRLIYTQGKNGLNWYLCQHPFNCIFIRLTFPCNSLYFICFFFYSRL